MKRRGLGEILDLYRLLGRQRPLFWFVLGASLVEALWGAVIFLSASALIQGVIDAAKLPWAGFKSGSIFAAGYEHLRALSPERRVLFGFVLTAGSIFLGGLMGLGQMILNVQFLRRFMVDLQTRCFETLLSYRLDFHDETRRSQLSQLIIVEARACHSVMKEVTTICGNLFRVAVSAVFMLVISWQLTTVFFALGLGAWAAMKRLNRLNKQWSSAALAARNELMAVTQDALYGVKQVKLLSDEGRMTARFLRVSASSMRYFARVFVLLNSQGTIMQLWGLLAVTAVIGIAWYIPGSVPVGGVVLFLFVAMGIVTPASASAREVGIINESLAAVRSVMGFLGLEGKLRERDGRLERRRLLADSLVFERVFLDYEGRAGILRDVSLEIHRGETVGIAGGSGAGKTSLVNLIPRLYDPAAGRVRVDGTDLREFSLRFLRGRIGLLSQDVFVFNATARENIMMGRPGATEAEMIAAAQLAHAHEFIMALPDGYDAVLGDRGVKLSGGQRQRINIAQVFLKNPEILVLDEATSALDSESEALVQDAIQRLSTDRTVIMIAHRLSTLRKADRIIVLDGGRIVEEGTWDELLRLDGVFARMWEFQSAGASLQGEAG